MKPFIVLQNREYISTKSVLETFGVDYKTLAAWVDKGLIPIPLRLGRRKYFDKLFLETQILASAHR